MERDCRARGRPLLCGRGETVELPRSEGPRGQAAAIMGPEFRRRGPSSRRHRAIAAKPDPGHRSTLGRGWRRQAIFMSIRSHLQGKIVTIFATDKPGDDCEELEGGFSRRFPPSRSGLRSSTSNCNHTHRRWGASAAAAQPRMDRNRKVGNQSRSKGGHPR